jgi:glycosyltransferase involved in cell wall biosynthesis
LRNTLYALYRQYRFSPLSFTYLILMRVLMISKACLVGAYQTKLEAIAAHDDIELTVIVPPVWRESSGEVRLEKAHLRGYDLLVEPIRFNGRYHFFYFPTLPRHLAAARPDILHIDEEPYNFATWLALRQAQAFARQQGQRCRTLFFSWQNLLKRYPWPFSMMERQVLRGVDYGLVGNNASAEVWRAKDYRGPLKVIPQFGVSPELFQPPTEVRSSERVIIGCANRRLAPEKGTHLLLEAAVGLPGAWQIRIMGEGPEKSRLIALARRLGLADRVHFDDVIPSTAMPAYLQRLDLLVLPSLTASHWKEQFGRVLIEAMACERAVVGSDSGEIPHVIGDAGLIFPEGNVAALRERLARLIGDPDLRLRLGQAGRARVLANYTQAQIAAQTTAVYREMMSDVYLQA